MKKIAVLLASLACMKAMGRPVHKSPTQVINNYYIKSGSCKGCGGGCHGH